MRQGFALSGPAVYIVPQVAGIGCHRGNGHSRVQHSASAQGDDEITAVFSGKGRALHHHLLEGVLHHLGELHDFHARLVELFHRAVIGAAHLGGPAVGHQQQSLLSGHGLLAELVQLAGAKQDMGGVVEIEMDAHVCFLLNFFRLNSVNQKVKTIDLLLKLVQLLKKRLPMPGK